MIHYYYTLVFLFASFSLNAQCFPDRHSSNTKDGWISCINKLSPNSVRGSGHWILYEFDSPKTIEGIKIWNSNLPKFTDIAIKTLAIDYSSDGSNWIELGAFSLNKSSGESTYEGETLDNIELFNASSILITAIESYGSQCAGLSEVKFLLSNSTTSTIENKDEWDISVYPNPAEYSTRVKIEDSNFDLQHVQIINVKGQIIKTWKENNVEFELNLSGVSEGAYFMKMIGKEAIAIRKLWIVQPK